LLDVYNGSKWVNVFSSGSITSSADVSAIFANPVTFTGMNISGLRLHSSIYVGNAFHQVSGATTYALFGTPAEVPEPATALLLGLGAAGIVALRRKSA
jgi:hypothetical protein